MSKIYKTLEESQSLLTGDLVELTAAPSGASGGVLSELLLLVGNDKSIVVIVSGSTILTGFLLRFSGAAAFCN